MRLIDADALCLQLIQADEKLNCDDVIRRIAAMPTIEQATDIDLLKSVANLYYRKMQKYGKAEMTYDLANILFNEAVQEAETMQKINNKKI